MQPTIQIKLLEADNLKDLERAANEFVKKHQVVDMKFNTSNDAGKKSYTLLLVYHTGAAQTGNQPSYTI